MIIRILLVNLALLFVFMTANWLIAQRRLRLDTVDVAWGLGFVVCAWSVELQHLSLRTYVLAAIVSVWGLRLSYHIYSRSLLRSDDPRYIELTRKWKGSYWRRAYVSLFLLQGFLIWIISVPLALAAGENGPFLRPLSVIGIALWLAGFIIEAIADRQLHNFQALKKKPKVLDSGLWRYSRHPNYFGELAQWWGIGLIALTAPFGWVGLIGPLTLTILIVFVSGIPPIEKRRQKDPAYRTYQKKTSALIPLPPKN